MIEFDRVSFTYPTLSRPAVSNVSIRVMPGEFALVVGASGTGKSTLLRMVNGLVPHFSGGLVTGNVRVDGLDPVAVTPQVMSRHVGFVFQDPESQFVTDRVEDEIAFALENVAMPAQEMRIRVEETLDLLDLAPLRERMLRTLSGGERQRVAIAAALALRPRVLVLDEPTSQLDPKSAEDVLTALVRLNQDLGLTVLLAEHRLERVLPFVDSIIYLPGSGGALRQGDPRTLLASIDLAPPLVQLAKALAWQPLPLTIKDGLRFSSRATPRLTDPAANRRASPTPARTVLRVEALRAGYHNQQVLAGIDLEAQAGEILVLMGRNGSGKTTLLKSMVGLIRPLRGRVLLDGADIAGRDVAELCRRVGYLPQDPNALLFADTVLDELMITLRNHGLYHNRDMESVYAPRQLLQELGLQHKEHAYPRDLSVGERQRVALAAVTVTQPAALLLDEPTRGLDYTAKQGLVGLLRRWREKDVAIVVVTHDVELAAQLADRIVLMSQGEIIAAGEPSAVLRASPFFAPQVAKLFPKTGWLTTDDALHGLLT